MKIVVFAIAALALAGCAAPPQKMTSHFDPADYAAYEEPGPNTVKGQAFLRQNGGGTVTCAGARVILFPATEYFRDAVSIMKHGRRPDGDGVGRAGKVVRQTRCDAQGNFAFDKVASGRWIVTTEVRWTIQYASQGGILSRELSVPTDDEPMVLLTDQDR